MLHRRVLGSLGERTWGEKREAEARTVLGRIVRKTLYELGQHKDYGANGLVIASQRDTMHALGTPDNPIKVYAQGTGLLTIHEEATWKKIGGKRFPLPRRASDRSSLGTTAYYPLDPNPNHRRLPIMVNVQGDAYVDGLHANRPWQEERAPNASEEAELLFRGSHAAWAGALVIEAARGHMPDAMVDGFQDELTDLYRSCGGAPFRTGNVTTMYPSEALALQQARPPAITP